MGAKYPQTTNGLTRHSQAVTLLHILGYTDLVSLKFPLSHSIYNNIFNKFEGLFCAFTKFTW